MAVKFPLTARQIDVKLKKKIRKGEAVSDEGEVTPT